jgi:predicted nucleotidyltransferase
MDINIEDIKKTKGIDAIYLFGSAASGKTHALSDIDICIIGNLNDQQKKKIMSFFSEDFDVSFFEELPVWIKIRVFRGKALFVKDKGLLFKTIMATVHEYEDFKPLIQRSIFRRFGKYA